MFVVNWTPVTIKIYSKIDVAGWSVLFGKDSTFFFKSAVIAHANIFFPVGTW